mgnify:CR=1 FL=1
MTKYCLEIEESDNWITLKNYTDLSEQKAKFLVNLCARAAEAMNRPNRIRMRQLDD